ncbi:MAG: Na/Pi cotransporter family protein [Firmicutes bacterium]|nr:Na/Pi cotransporter family protein [Bacillota bacterium]MCL5057441.1 Na/Pi cotransporter family protein [Actinomycetota bacterium]
MWHIVVLGLIGGMGLLLYGMQILSEGLQKIAGAKLRTVMSTLTQNRLSALAVGATITVLFQSSTATTVILVGLTSAGIMSLKQTLGVILGADIGTTVTAQLIALKVTEIALPIVGLGATIIFFTKRERYRRYGQVLMGFGLLFLGLKIMSEVMYPLRENPLFPQMMAKMSDNPILAMLIASVFTFLIHSSAASIGIIMVLSMQHLVSLHAAIYLLFGANIGTSFTAILSSLGSSRESQRVATAHLLFKVAGVIVFLPFVGPFIDLMEKITSSPGYQVANAHTFFNIVLAIVFTPFVNQFARLLMKIVPEKRKTGEVFGPRYLDIKLINTPAIALGLATKEINRTFDYVYEMTKDILLMLEKNDVSIISTVAKKEDRVDILFKEISEYLTNVLRQPHSKEEFVKCMGLINIVNDLEHIGDIIEKNVTYLAQCKIDGHCSFSEEGWDDISIMHKKVCDLMQMTSTAFVTSNHDLAEKAYKLQPEITKMERHLRVLHIHRLRINGSSEEEGALYLDLINALLRISEHIRNIAWEVANEGLEYTASGERVAMES